MKYEFSENPPTPIDREDYIQQATSEFQRLLDESSHNEVLFQEFFERNPSFVPGARGEFEAGFPSGHSPHLNCLISQPKINGLARRHPDFMWIAQDSMVLSPILIEIEAPSKKYFNKDGSPSSNFTKAKNQLDEWRAILSRPENILSFYRDYSLTEDMTSLQFEPYYVLIYGRRSEFENDTWLKQKRANLMSRSDNQVLMSFDRLSPKSAETSVICSTVNKGKYKAKCISPTFELSVFASHLTKISNLEEAADNMQFTTSERRDFIKSKIPHLLDFLNSPEQEGLSMIFDGRKLQFDE
jgi:hypothetical protein